MKRFALKRNLVSVFLVLSALFFCQGEEKGGKRAEKVMEGRAGNLPDFPPAEKEVYDSYRKSCDAMISKDKSALESLFDENLVFVHMSGKRQTRDEYIAEILDGTLNYFKITDNRIEIRVEGDSAFLKVTHRLDAKVYGIRGAWTMRGDFVYRKRNGNWVRVKN